MSFTAMPVRGAEGGGTKCQLNRFISSKGKTAFAFCSSFKALTKARTFAGAVLSIFLSCAKMESGNNNSSNDLINGFVVMKAVLFIKYTTIPGRRQVGRGKNK